MTSLSQRASARRRALTVAALLSLVASGAALMPAVPAAAGERPASTSQLDGTTGRLIVRTGPALSQVEEAVATAGGRVAGRQPGLGIIEVDGPAGLGAAVSAVPGVVSVAPDRRIGLLSLGFDPAGQPGSLTNVTRLTGATTVWKAGYTGAGIDVALIDTGVAPVPGLQAATKVVIGPDLSVESQSAEGAYLDGYGHGTHMAGIILGRETGAASGATYAADTKNFYGMAPDARLVSIKVADHDGSVDVSQVIAAIDWVTQFGHSNGLNVRVINLSLGLDSEQNPQDDPLAWAAEVAWSRGTVVVASGGNSGDRYPGLNSPAYDKRILAVGAADTKGTASVKDDVVPSFSAFQGGAWGDRPPDIVAPGTGIVSLKVPGSVIATTYPAAAVASNFIRGSGTSQAAAVVSGAVALLLQQRPGLTPDQVKALLVASAANIPSATHTYEGKGELDVAAASRTAVPSRVQSVTAGTGTGSLEIARGGLNLSMDRVTLKGERTIFGTVWDGDVTGPRTARATMWSSDGSSFQGVAVTGTGFSTSTGGSLGGAWGGRSWVGRSWVGNSWSGRSWVGRSWVGRSWVSNTWSTGSWTTPLTSAAWAGGVWSTGDWK